MMMQLTGSTQRGNSREFGRCMNAGEDMTKQLQPDRMAERVEGSRSLRPVCFK